MKSAKLDRFGLVVLGGTTIAMLLCILIGVRLDARAFAVNVISGVLCLAIGLLIGWLVVERYAQHQRRERWKRVRDLTYGSISMHLCDLLTDEYIFFPLKDLRGMNDLIEGRTKPSAKTVTAIEMLNRQLRASPPRSTDRSEDDVALEFCQEVEDDLKQITEVLTPRVIDSSDDQDVIDALIAFDRCWREVQNAVIVHTRIRAGAVFKAVLGLNESAQALYSVLLDRWMPVG